MINNLNDIFAKIDTLGLIAKQKNMLKLLSEEAWLLASEFLDANNIDYSLTMDNNNCYEIKITADSNVSEERRKDFLSVGKGKNSKSKGLLGKLSAVFESMLYSYDLNKSSMPSDSIAFIPSPSGLSYSSFWSMSGDIEGNSEKEWDGLEKSIIANLADDVTVGIRFGKIEMLIKKKF